MSKKISEEKTNSVSDNQTKDQASGFILKVYQILQVSFLLKQTQEYHDIISWNERGDGFLIKSISHLEKTILPQYFKHDKLQSFIRQLNIYNFHKIRTKDQNKEFRHEYLRKGKKELLKLIKRKVNDEYSSKSSQSNDLLIKCQELESKCKDFEKLKLMEKPIKKLKLVPSNESEVLLEGLQIYLGDQTSNCSDTQKELMKQITEEYIQKLLAVKNGKYGETKSCGNKSVDSDSESTFLTKRSSCSDDESDSNNQSETFDCPEDQEFGFENMGYFGFKPSENQEPHDAMNCLEMEFDI